MKRKVIATMLAATLAYLWQAVADLQVHLIHLSHQVLQRAAQPTKTNHCAGLTVSHPTVQPENLIRRH